MKKIILPSLVVALLSLGACSVSTSTNNGVSNSAAIQTTGTSSNALMLQLAMRKLWSDHVIWTRQYIVAAVAGAPDAQAAADRLLKNQDDIGNAIVPYYGSDAGIKL